MRKLCLRTCASILFSHHLGFSWFCALVAFGLLSAQVNFLTILPYILGPTISAFIMSRVTQGSAGIRYLLQRYVLWRVHSFWYLFIVLGIPLIYVIGVALVPGALASYQPAPTVYWVAFPLNVIIVLFIGGPLFEEPGWRGYALPRMQDQFAPLTSALSLGLIWALWHLPVYSISCSSIIIDLFHTSGAVGDRKQQKHSSQSMAAGITTP